jgi:hypothetical protein
MKSHFAKFTGVLCLSMAIAGQGLAQSPVTTVPNVAQLQNTAMKLAIAGGAASAAITVITLVAHHHHKSQAKETLSRGGSAAQLPSSPDALKSRQGGESKPVDAQSSSTQSVPQF